jgi:hypothetical protein
LVDYYAPDSEHCGISILAGTEGDHPYTIVAGDPFTVTTLGLQVRPAVVRRLLDESPHAVRVTGCLAEVRIDATLSEAGADGMGGLYAAVPAAFDPRPRPPSAKVVASAVCARKRPELFRVLDPEFCGAFGLPGAANPQASWQAVREVLGAR